METPKQAPWTLRLRGPKGGPSSLEVPSGGDATLKVRRCLPLYRLVKSSHPSSVPRPVLSTLQRALTILRLSLSLSLKDLVKLSAKAVKIAQKRVVIKYGFPPKEVAEEATTTIAEAGIRDRDVIVIERRKDLDVFDDAKGGLRVSVQGAVSKGARLKHVRLSRQLCPQHVRGA